MSVQIGYEIKILIIVTIFGTGEIMVHYVQSVYYITETEERVMVCVITESNSSAPRPFTLKALTNNNSSGSLTRLL